MVLELPHDAKRLLAEPVHRNVTEMLLQFVNVSFDDTVSRLLFPTVPLTDGEKAVLEAEARVLMGLRKNLADAFRLARESAAPGAKAGENSPAGFV